MTIPVAPYLNFSTSTQNSRHGRQCDTHLCVHTALELHSDTRIGSQLKSTRACWISRTRNVLRVYQPANAQQCQEGLSIDFGCQPRDSEIRFAYHIIFALALCSRECSCCCCHVVGTPPAAPRAGYVQPYSIDMLERANADILAHHIIFALALYRGEFRIPFSRVLSRSFALRRSRVCGLPLRSFLCHQRDEGYDDEPMSAEDE